MVKGLDVFTKALGAWSDQYVLIGGTAAYLSMDEAGLKFRATKDLDVVLIVEALTPEFGAALWAFIGAGGYRAQETSTQGKRGFYRFHKPADDSYPAMIELFARAPDALKPMEAGTLTPIPLDEELSSLSAILLDESYYTFVVAGRRENEGLAWVDETRLIPLKASAWLDLRDRKEKGDEIDSHKIRKHALDVLRLSQLLTAETRIEVSGRIRDDLLRFLAEARADDTLEPKSLGIRTARDQILARIAAAYGLS